jgi:hypothetical protein
LREINRPVETAGGSFETPFLDTQNAGDIWVPILMMIKTSGKTAGK